MPWSQLAGGYLTYVSDLDISLIKNSHIFCFSCSDHSGLSSSVEGNRTCPACQTNLPNLDDAVSTQLNPSEDYKTSVLSGLSPGTIMECAGRGLAFWTYQATQEVVYQEYLAKTWTEKYTTLNSQMDRLINDANAEIADMRHKLTGITSERDELQRKNHEIVEAFREKSRKHLQTQQLYDKLKRRTLLSQVQSAASLSVDQTVQSTAGRRLADRDGINEGDSRYHEAASVPHRGAQYPPHAVPNQPSPEQSRPQKRPNSYQHGDGTRNMAPSIRRPEQQYACKNSI
ncbi:MAG: hypothetical protein M1819_001381 [Sarea resinae]|nr:MAG: hypothetical protein M1819_001381 [Sarea resinae]